ncbi:hypothetical protein GCK32_020222, partial [Trichostrongylus colubriformis]
MTGSSEFDALVDRTNQFQRSNRTRQAIPEPGYTCFRCGGEGHFASTCGTPAGYKRRNQGAVDGPRPGATARPYHAAWSTVVNRSGLPPFVKLPVFYVVL